MSDILSSVGKIHIWQNIKVAPRSSLASAVSKDCSMVGRTNCSGWHCGLDVLRWQPAAHKQWSPSAVFITHSYLILMRMKILHAKCFFRSAILNGVVSARIECIVRCVICVLPVHASYCGSLTSFPSPLRAH